ncbi:MAG: SGNH/GDSL hydrolase family protein [Pirellulales bacterium]
MRTLIYAAVIVAAFAGASLSADEIRGPLASIKPKNGDTFVFLGDSITQQCLYTQYVENYFYTRMPHLRLKFHNAGVSGDTAADALVRFDRDVARYRPQYVTVLLGMNDGAAKQFEASLFDQYRTDVQKLIEKIENIGAVPILITPTMYDTRMAALNPKVDSRGRGGYYNGVLALYGAYLRDLAGDRGLGFVDTYAPLNQFTIQQRKRDPKFTLIPDGIHPDASGHLVMAYALAADLGLPKRVTTIQVNRKSAGDPDVKIGGGKLVEARSLGAGVEFTYLADALPLPVPAGAEVGAKLIPLGHRLGLEAFHVHGLASGRYKLSINDQPIGVYAAEVLAAKLELQDNELTPQYRQAQQVAELNARRTAEAIVPLRNLWKMKKILTRARRPN